MQFSLLASGSSGNCLLVVDGDTRVLIDAGISCKQITTRLRGLGVEPASLSALCLTHDHTDHIGGLAVLSRRLPLPVYATEGTSTAAECKLELTALQWNLFAAGNPFQIGSLVFEPFAVPHDAGDPVGFVVHNGTRRLGIATDLGHVPAMVTHHLRSCHALVLECNHDLEMLRNSDRAWSLKERIMGRHGHLSNLQSAELLESLMPGALATLVLAHLSDECNTPALARNTILDVLGRHGLRETVRLHLASTEPTPLIEV